MNKQENFDEFRFKGLNHKPQSNKYMTMNRVSDDEKKVVVKVGEGHLIETRFGYALILDATRVIFLKDWQVSINYYGCEVLLDKEFFKVKEWGYHPDILGSEDRLNFDRWLSVAKLQQEHMNLVQWKRPHPKPWFVKPKF